MLGVAGARTVAANRVRAIRLINRFMRRDDRTTGGEDARMRIENRFRMP